MSARLRSPTSPILIPFTGDFPVGSEKHLRVLHQGPKRAKGRMLATIFGRRGVRQSREYVNRNRIFAICVEPGRINPKRGHDDQKPRPGSANSGRSWGRQVALRASPGEILGSARRGPSQHGNDAKQSRCR